MKSYHNLEIAILKKGALFGTIVRVGTRFDSKVNSKRNPSGVSYYIEGYELRNWCFLEEIKKTTIIHRIIIHIFKFSNKFNTK
jgi:hypothetical protein